MGRIPSLEERQKRAVHFRFASGEKVPFRLVDEARYVSQQAQAEYMNLLQLFEAEEGQQLIRIAYYRRPIGGDDESWEYGSQDSLALEAENWRGLFGEALKKPWFRSLAGEALPT